MIPCDQLREWCASYGLAADEQLLNRLDNYAQFLIEYNEKVNLTAITDPAEIAQKHFLDSLLLLAAAKIPEGASLIDVGTGAGFPGVPVRLARPDLHLTLLDSLNKRVVFLRELCTRLDIEADVFHARAEDAAHTALREQFDFATARAVASLPVLCEYCLPFVKVGGMFAALKSRSAAEELEASRKALSLLGGRLEEEKVFLLPDSSERRILLIRKISQTPPKYPRPSAKMAKNPL